MKYSLIIDPEREEEVIVYAHERTKLAERIEELVTEEKHELIGYRENEIVRLYTSEISCFYSEEGRVFARVMGERYLLKLRLYQLEELLPSDFLKINQSCLVNIEKIKRFDSSIGASLRVMLDDGYRDYVSRRQLKTVKERLGL